jgi:carbon storage regulator
MLVLSRRKGESIQISDNITITIVDIRGDKIQIGIKAPREVAVHRSEIAKLIEDKLKVKSNLVNPENPAVS